MTTLLPTPFFRDVSSWPWWIDSYFLPADFIVLQVIKLIQDCAISEIHNITGILQSGVRKKVKKIQWFLTEVGISPMSLISHRGYAIVALVRILKGFLLHVTPFFHCWLERQPPLQPFLWCNRSEPKISWFVCLFYGFVTGWFLEIQYLLIRSVLGSSQSSQTITTLTPEPAVEPTPLRPGALTGRCAHTTATSWVHVLGMASHSGHTGKRGFCALRGLAQTVNNGTKPRMPLLLWKCAVTHFAACPCSGCFICFPNNHFFCKSQITRAQQMLLPGWKGEQGLETHPEEERQWERVSTLLSECCSPPLLKHLSYASPACLCPRAANWAKSRGDFVRQTNVG